MANKTESKKEYFFLMEQLSSLRSWRVHRAKKIDTVKKYYDDFIKNYWKGKRTFFIVNADKAVDARTVVMNRDDDNTELFEKLFGRIITKIDHNLKAEVSQ